MLLALHVCPREGGHGKGIGLSLFLLFPTLLAIPNSIMQDFVLRIGMGTWETREGPTGGTLGYPRGMLPQLQTCLGSLLIFLASRLQSGPPLIQEERLIYFFRKHVDLFSIKATEWSNSHLRGKFFCVLGVVQRPRRWELCKWSKNKMNLDEELSPWGQSSQNRSLCHG